MDIQQLVAALWWVLRDTKEAGTISAVAHLLIPPDPSRCANTGRGRRVDDPEAADVDPPLLETVKGWLDQLFAGGFSIEQTIYGAAGEPERAETVSMDDPSGDTLVAVLATRNQAVDDAQDMVDRLIERHGLADGVIIASTVDSWQGQTNAITVAIHPLSGASALDEFNAAFGRLAVTCTRATHGLLIVSRASLDDLLSVTAPRPGTPLGEPGNRQLPRQTHQRILSTFARGRFDGGPAVSVVAS